MLSRVASIHHVATWWADTAEQRQKQKRLRTTTTGRESGVSKLNTIVSGGSREQAAVQWQGGREGGGAADAAFKTEQPDRAGRAAEEKEGAEGLKEEAGKVGLDLLWWTDTNYRAKTAEEEEAAR